jgi:hypothetical protein
MPFLSPPRRRTNPRIPGVRYDRFKGQPLSAWVRIRRGKLSHALMPRRDVEVYVNIGKDGHVAGFDFCQPVSAAIALDILCAAFERHPGTAEDWSNAVAYCARAMRWWDKQIAAAAA